MHTVFTLFKRKMKYPCSSNIITTFSCKCVKTKNKTWICHLVLDTKALLGFVSKYCQSSLSQYFSQKVTKSIFSTDQNTSVYSETVNLVKYEETFRHNAIWAVLTAGFNAVTAPLGPKFNRFMVMVQHKPLEVSNGFQSTVMPLSCCVWKALHSFYYEFLIQL